jgi:hypothetical protein
VPFFVEAEILCIMWPQQTLKYLLILYTNTTDQWKRYLPILLDPMHLADEFPKVAWGDFGEVLVEGNLLPALLQIPPLLRKNLKVNR